MIEIPITTIPPTVVNILITLLTKVLEGSTKKWSENIFEIVKDKLNKRQAGKEAVNDFENDPKDNDFQASLRVQIKKALLEDEKFQKELGAMLTKNSDKAGGASFLQQFSGDNAKQFGNVTGSTVIIDESQAKAETRVGKFSTVEGDVKAVVYYSPEKDLDSDEGETKNGDETEQ
jgi:hypothetical protein